MGGAYPHAATVWQREGEDASRRAVWRRRTVPRCRWAEARGLSNGTLADPRDDALLLVPRGSGGCGVSWELGKGDRVSPERSVSPVPIETALSVGSIRPVSRGRFVDHYEAAAS